MREGPPDQRELERVVADIRKDVRSLHRDLVFAGRDRWHWTFVTLWLVFALVLKEFWELGNFAAFGLSLLMTRIYLEIDGFRMAKRPPRIVKEPLQSLELLANPDAQPDKDCPPS